MDNEIIVAATGTITVTTEEYKEFVAKGALLDTLLHLFHKPDVKYDLPEIAAFIERITEYYKAGTKEDKPNA